jgi:hypothetical protein
MFNLPSTFILIFIIQRRFKMFNFEYNRGLNSFTTLLLLLFFILQITSYASMTQKDTLGFTMLSIKKGDRCIVCAMPLKEGKGIVLLVRGRRVAIDVDHIKEFLANKAKYLSQLEPRGALFQESAVLESTLRSGWFLLGAWIVLALISAAISAHMALRKGFNSLKWFFIGLALNFVGIFFIFTKSSDTKIELPPHLAKIPNTAFPVECPDCGESNHPASEQCSGCGKRLDPKFESEVKRAGVHPFQ